MSTTMTGCAQRVRVANLTEYCFALLGFFIWFALVVGASSANAQADYSGSAIINEPNGFPGVCTQPCFSIEKSFEVYLDGNPSGPGVCAAGDNTYLYTLTHLGGTGPFVPALTKFSLSVANAAVNVTSAGFIPGVLDPSATVISTTLDVVEWDFLAPPVANGQTSSQLFVCSPLLPGSSSDNLVSVGGQASLDAPGTCVGPFVEPVSQCDLKVEKFCEVVGGGGPGDKDKDKDFDGTPDPPDEGDQVCKGRVKSLVFEYTGLGCAASNNPQGYDPELVTGRKGKALCRGATRHDTVGATGQNGVRIRVKDGRKRLTYLDQSDINVGDEVVVEASAVGRKSLRGSLKVWIYDSAGARIELNRFKSNCRKAEYLGAGDQYGSLRLNEIVLKDGTTITVATLTPELPELVSECTVPLPRVGLAGDKDKDKDTDPNQGGDVTYTYRIMNISPPGGVTATDITVVDDVLGVVPGSPIATLAPGATVDLMATQLITVDTINTVTVTGNPGMCMAQAAATVLVEQPADVPDKDKDKDKDKDND
ncbi:MAG: hypothetical protein VX681_13265 [Myxococcota bacterium]|nr:hypothetical protein [Myxococcota bacterium]